MIIEINEERQKITGQVSLPPALFGDLKKTVQNLSDLQQKLVQTEQKDMSATLGILLVSAILLDASDLHLEPAEGQAKIRLRVDGMLQDITAMPFHVYQNLLSRIKLISGIKLNIADRPQDGRFSIAWGEKLPVEVRVATLPSEYAESAVLRILNPEGLKNLKDLGLRQDLLEMFRAEIQKPDGMIIVTGPTGTGKTTTLYAFLKEIQKPEIKIITIEDPIEYRTEGISQTQVNPSRGYDFASGLKAIVRQDPDVILVGEIRDEQTAEIALQAALTGHLVLSTLHTNDAAGTIARFLSLNAKPANIAAALRLIIAQRLVRKVCPACSVLQEPGAEEFKKIKEELAKIKLKPKPLVSPNLKIARAQGCKTCNGTGYKGRTTICEAIRVDASMEEFILKSPPISSLKKFAIQKGMVTMYQDGLLKVIDHVSTVQEVERVTAQ